MIIDYLKMITDPMGSYWRIEKSFDRLLKMQTYYPLPKFTKPIDIGESENDEIIKQSLDIILNEITNKDIIIVGFYAYNYFLEKSKFYEKNRKISKINIPYLEIISKNYKQDFDYIIEKLKTQYGDLISHTEYFPLFTFLGNCVEIYLDGDLILIIYDYDKRCTPYLNIENELKLGTFSLTLMYAQINVMKFRIMNDDAFKTMYTIMVSHLIQMKNCYFLKTKKTIFDDTPFKDFIIDCIASDVNPDHAILIKYENRRAKNKPSMFIYDPLKCRKEEKEPTFCFPNISGNEIRNEKRLKLKDGLCDDSSVCSNDENLEVDDVLEDVLEN
jgi:hypothetical protein